MKAMILDAFEQEIEDNIEKQKPIEHMEQETTMLIAAAKLHVQHKLTQEQQ